MTTLKVWCDNCYNWIRTKSLKTTTNTFECRCGYVLVHEENNKFFYHYENATYNMHHMIRGDTNSLQFERGYCDNLNIILKEETP